MLDKKTEKVPKQAQIKLSLNERRFPTITKFTKGEEIYYTMTKTPLEDVYYDGNCKERFINKVESFK